MQARLDALKKRGLNPFMQYQLPQAVISLKQGAGRLIRGVDDRGVLVTGDMRMLNRPYGKVFIDAMPSFTRTRQQQDVEQFFSGESA
jgi:ATP-dependent DNA helicase DinG